MADLLLANKADVIARALSDYTPLHDAAFWGYKEVAELLLASGASVDAEGLDGGTPPKTIGAIHLRIWLR